MRLRGNLLEGNSLEASFWGLLIGVGLVEVLQIRMTNGSKMHCETKSRHCVNSARLPTKFECPGPGRFPAAPWDDDDDDEDDIDEYFFKCEDVGFYACKCRCRGQRFFDSALARCRKDKTFGIHNHHHHRLQGEGEEEENGVWKTDDDDVIIAGDVIDDQQATVVRSHDDEKNNASRAKLDSNSNSNLSNSPDVVPGRRSEKNPKVKDSNGPETQGSRDKSLVLHDNAAFPPWAIALLVLCLVIIMILIVLILY